MSGAFGIGSSRSSPRRFERPDTQPTPPSPPAPTAKRQVSKRRQVHAACEACQRRKVKCDAQRPRCIQCRRRDIDCKYEIAENQTRVASYKRQNESLLEELRRYQHLFELLCSRQIESAEAILRKIRSSRDPLAVLDFVKQADLTVYGLLTETPLILLDPRLRRFDNEVLQQSQIRVHARPWTTVVGDGMVSELLSCFFQWNHPFFFAFIDEDCFLEDMASVSDAQEDLYCTPLLVNAICSMACLLSPHARRYDALQGGSLHERFHEETKHLLDIEGGHASIPAVQASLLIFMYQSAVGRDRAGLTYKHQAYEMLKNLNLDRRYEHSLLQRPTRDHKAASVVTWGLFCAESHTSLVYNKPSLGRLPSLSRYFTHPPPGGESQTRDSQNRATPDHWSVLLNSLCDLSVINNCIMSYVVEDEEIRRSPEDVENRLKLFNRLSAWKDELPVKLQCDGNPLINNYFLQDMKDMFILRLFYDLQSTDLDLGVNLGTPADVCLAAAQRLLSSERYDSCLELPPEMAHCMFVQAAYCVVFTLALRLDHDSRTHEPFTRACRVLHDHIPKLSVTRLLLYGLRAFAAQLNIQLPRQVTQMMEDLKPILPTRGGIPMAFILPAHEDMSAALTDDGLENTDNGPRLASIISKWKAMSMDG